MTVGVFGYGLLSKCTITRERSNRNRKMNKPEQKLDPKKLLAIRGTATMPRNTFYVGR